MKKNILLIILLSLSIYSNAQITVNSLQELKTYLDDDNVNIKLAPGTYRINATDISSGKWGYTVPHIDWARAVIQFEGSNSTYDFTDVILNIDTDVFTAFGNLDIWTFHNMGNDNVFKNLTMIDDGSVHDAPRRGVTNVVIDGQDNVIDGFYVNSKGSYPYGYSEIFGKGPNNTISTRKHSSILIRGTRNTLKNTKVFHQAFGHCVFMQAADSPTIENCYIQGEVRSTDDILAEEGTGSLADEMEFMTTWGYKLPTGYMLALCEEGIRSYNAGETLINGEFYSRGSSDITVLNSTVKNTRVGVSLTLASGSRRVENVTVLGSEVGFSLRGSCIDCKADCIYGPVYQSTYDNDSWDADITILPPSDDYYNGGKCIAYIGSDNCDVTLRGGTDSKIPADYEIRLGGLVLTKSFLLNNTTQENHRAQSVNLENYTGYPIDIVFGSNNNTVTTCGPVTDEGSNNSVTQRTDCGLTGVTCNNTVAKIEAECFTTMLGVVKEPSSEGGENIGSIGNGDWAAYNGVDLTGMNSVQFRIASKSAAGGNIEVRLGSITGTLIGTIPVTSTGDWQTYVTKSVNIPRVTGNQNIYLVFKNSSGTFLNINWFGFSEDVVCNNTTAKVEAECYTTMSGIQTENCTEGTKNVGWIQDGDWMSYSNVDLTGMKSIKVRTSGNTKGSTIEVRTGSETGTLIATLPISNTDGFQNWTTDSVNLASVSGTQDVFLVFKGGTGYLFNVNWLGFSEETLLVTGFSDPVDSEIMVYPNPAQNELYIRDIEEGTYELIDQKGTTYKSGNITSKGQIITLDSLSNGIYLLKIIQKNSVKTVKIVKE